MSYPCRSRFVGKADVSMTFGGTWKFWLAHAYTRTIKTEKDFFDFLSGITECEMLSPCIWKRLCRSHPGYNFYIGVMSLKTTGILREQKRRVLFSSCNISLCHKFPCSTDFRFHILPFSIISRPLSFNLFLSHAHLHLPHIANVCNMIASSQQLSRCCSWRMLTLDIHRTS